MNQKRLGNTASNRDKNMTDTPAFLIITAIPNPEKMEAVQTYLSQIMPVLVAGGGKPVGRYSVTNQLDW